jgi:hypothetical protein
MRLKTAGSAFAHKRRRRDSLADIAGDGIARPVYTPKAPSSRVRWLYWECRGQRYYAGPVGTQSRHETRPPYEPR